VTRHTIRIPVAPAGGSRTPATTGFVGCACERAFAAAQTPVAAIRLVPSAVGNPQITEPGSLRAARKGSTKLKKWAPEPIHCTRRGKVNMTEKDSGPEEGIKGVVEDVKGKTKETVGTVTGRDDMVREGKAQQDKADAQQDAAKKEAEAESARSGAKAAEKRQEANQ
jgi:uncharacterized protein YjbJ (UPF0337 family)